MAINITKAVPADAVLLAEIGRRTFLDAFASVNSKEDMAAYLGANYTEQKLLTEINTPGVTFLLAQQERETLGFAKVGTQSPPDEIAAYKCMELERLYILQQYQGLKLGEQLIQYCIDKARTEGYEILWLGVWEHNLRAIAFYRRLGFERFGEHIFQLGSDAQTDWLMKLKL